MTTREESRDCGNASGTLEINNCCYGSVNGSAGGICGLYCGGKVSGEFSINNCCVLVI